MCPVVMEAEKESLETCQFCGRRPATRTTNSMVVMTLCDWHRPFDHDARRANFELFTSQVEPVPPTIEEVRQRLLAARDDLVGHGILSVAILPPPADDPSQHFIVGYRGTDYHHLDPNGRTMDERVWSMFRTTPSVIGWPTMSYNIDGDRDWRRHWTDAATGLLRQVEWIWKVPEP